MWTRYVNGFMVEYERKQESGVASKNLKDEIIVQRDVMAKFCMYVSSLKGRAVTFRSGELG